MTDLYLLLAGATAILIGLLVIVCEAGRSIAWRKAYVEVTDLGLALARDMRGVHDRLDASRDNADIYSRRLWDEVAGVRQETERAVAHLRHKYDEEIVFAETERNKIIEDFSRVELRLRDKLEAAGDRIIGRPASAKYHTRPVPEKRSLGGSIGGPSNASQTRGGSLTQKGLAEVFVEEAEQPGGAPDG